MYRLLSASQDTYITNKGIIYLITNLKTNMSYVGQTTVGLKDRWRRHCYDAQKRKSQTYLARAIRKYGSNCFHVVILEETVDLSAREQHWIKKLGTQKQGYNLTSGGEGTPGHICSDNTKRKMSLAMKGRKFSEEHKKNLSMSRKGKAPWNKGIFGKENPLFGKRRSLKVCKKISESKYRKVIQLSLTGKRLKIFPSLLAAAKETGASSQNITKACRGQRKKAAGYRWMYTEEEHV